MRACTKCGERKPLTGFYRRGGGRHSQCKTCRDEYRATRPRSSNYRATNLASYYRNPTPYRVARAKRRAAELQRTVSWGDTEWQQFALSEIYECARLRSMVTGVPHEVDHIIPLQGKQVSGLHIVENLRVVTRQENRRKGAKH